MIMTEHEIEKIRGLIRTMKLRHPFKWKTYKDHVSIVMYLMDAVDELEKLIHKEEFPVLYMSEAQSMAIVKQAGKVVQAVNLWKQSILFHNFLIRKVDDMLADAINGTYEYVQTMLNLVVADMNKTMLEYIEALKDEVIRRSQEEFEEYEVDIEDRTINVTDGSDIDVKEKQFTNILQLRNEATAKRIIAHNAVASFKSLLYYDYIEIIRGIDIISKMKYENKSVSKAFGKSTFKFIDFKSTEEDKK
jgi:hypothetical protein